MAESFANLLKRHRIAAGLSQEALAERARVSVDTIGYLERDVQHAPQKATLDLLIIALALDDGSRLEIEEAAKIARARGPQAERQPNNLPPQLTSFVDRERETAEIKELLRFYRLVTVVGSGGVGKSRCGLQVARGMFEGFSDGVWLAELAPISEPALVATVVAHSLRLQETPNRPMLDTLLAHLERKRSLFIFDNCEHVIDEARRVVAALLHSCPYVRILATSRESFGIAGEQVYRMPSLPVPSASVLQSADEIAQYGAVQLFSERAVSADNRFTLTVESAPHVADICRRLDGIPLAIELAAARVKVLSPRELAQKLDERFRLLTTGDRSALPRHRTMRALIDWSYDLLSDRERELFRKVSIFAGGFTLETVAAICGDFEMDEIIVVDLLSSLVDKSLVQREMVGSSGRYRLLESTRQYAHEKLRDAGEDDTVARSHACAFVTLAEKLDDAYDTTSDCAWFAQAEAELENFREALFWAFGPRGDALLGQRLASALRRVWHSFSMAEGRHWVQTALARITADTPVAVLAALDLAEALSAQNFYQEKAALRAAELALARYGELADPRGITEAKLLSGRAQMLLGEVAEGEALLRQALEALPAPHERRSVIFALEGLGVARSLAGDLHEARRRYSEALVIAQAIGAKRYAAMIAAHLAEAEFRGGDVSEALRIAEENLEVLRALGDTLRAGAVQSKMAAYLVALCRYNEARIAARDALAAARDTQYSVGLAFALQHLAAIAALRPSDEAPIDDHRRAARILGYVDVLLAALDATRDTEQKEYDAVLRALGDALGAGQLTQLMAEGSTWSEDQAVAEAMLV